MRTDGSMITGKGRGNDERSGSSSGGATGRPNHAGHARRELGSLDRIERLIKTLGMVTPPRNSELIRKVITIQQPDVEIWGEIDGKGAAAPLDGSLPGNIAVEVEAIFES